MRHLPYTPERAIEHLSQRVRWLERIASRNQRPHTYEISPASQYGAVTVTALADTPEWDVWVGGQITALIARLRTAGSANTVVTFYLNGSSIGTVTLGSGVNRGTAYVNERVKNTDGIAAVVTTAGAGAKGLSGFVRMKG